MRILTSKHKIALCTSFLLFLFVSLLFVGPVFAQSENLLQGQEGMGDIQAVFGETEDIRITIAKMINIVLSVLAAIFVVLIVIAGFKYMTASGNEEKVKDALKQIQQAVIGLIIILMAWSITRFIILRLVAASSGQSYWHF